MSRVLKTGSNRITQTYAQHSGWAKGVDVVKAPALLDVVKAHTEGTVIKVVTGQTNGSVDDEGFGYGNYVMIAHNDNYVTLYAHLGSIEVKQGQKVSKGYAIGYMGNTGNSSGAHLHFELRKYDNFESNLHDKETFEFIDPTPYLDIDLPVSAENEIFRVQTHSFEIRENAERMAEELRSKKFDVLVKFFNGHYRMQVGAFSKRHYAENMLIMTQLAGYKDAYITTEGGIDVAM